MPKMMHYIILYLCSSFFAWFAFPSASTSSIFFWNSSIHTGSKWGIRNRQKLWQVVLWCFPIFCQFSNLFLIFLGVAMIFLYILPGAPRPASASWRFLDASSEAVLSCQLLLQWYGSNNWWIWRDHQHFIQRFPSLWGTWATKITMPSHDTSCLIGFPTLRCSIISKNHQKPR